MNKEQIEILVGGLSLALKLAGMQINVAEGLTEEEKQAFIARIQAAQLSVPDWE